MAHSFKTNPAKPSFGVFNESKDSGEYILNKHAKTVYCNANLCCPSKPINTQGNLLQLTKSKYLNYNSSFNSFNKANLNINLITKLDLENVPVIQSNNPYAVPTTINTSAIPFLDYTIDPSGNLFGNTICDINNYENYMVPSYKTQNM